MKVILNQDVQNLGEEGDICDVKDGYARNFLLPRSIAVPYNRLHINNFKAKEAAIATRKESKRKDALSLKERLEKEIALEVVMPSAGGGRLFGSVTSSIVAEQLAHQGIDIERKRIEVPGRNIKVVGNYVVKVRLYDEQVASVPLVVRSLEAEKEAEKKEEAPDEMAESSEKEMPEVSLDEEMPAVAENE